MADIDREKESHLDWDYLFDILDYNSETGIFTNKVTRNSRAVKGNIAGNVNKGYIRITINKEKYLAHRLAWFYEYGKWPENLIDHKDNIGTHNWIDNLRDSTHSQNSFNKGNIGGTSKFKGVRWDRGKWKAQIKFNKKYKHLGRFDIEKDAAIAYNNAAIELHGEFALLNKI
jgi:hypothetical protein